MARESANRAQRAEIDAAMADPANGVARLRAVISATGADRRVEEMIAVREAAALDALRSAPIDPAARRALTKLAQAAAHRKA